MQYILVTGSAGFIGSNFISHWLSCEPSTVVSLDKLTYAGNLTNLASIRRSGRHIFIKGDIRDQQLVSKLLKTYRPAALINFAAETHVDRSIVGAEHFVETNVGGTFHLLETIRLHACMLVGEFRFVQISTDEVYGSLPPESPGFSENSPFAPNNPYAASKASADLLARSFLQTYNVPVITTRCSNNYGPRQFVEKLIPRTIQNARAGLPIPVYGDGRNVRDWLYVIDHCEAIRRIVKRGRVGEIYNIGGECEKSNLVVVEELCALLAKLQPGPDYGSFIRFVPDRPGHDRRYAMCIDKIRCELEWSPTESFSSGLRKTVEWYLTNTSVDERAISRAIGGKVDTDTAARNPDAPVM